METETIVKLLIALIVLAILIVILFLAPEMFKNIINIVKNFMGK